MQSELQSELKVSLLEKLKNKTSVVGIIGLGYVGLPLALRYSEVGYRVFGFDVNFDKITKLKEGLSYICHIEQERIMAAIKTNFFPTTEIEFVREADAIILCVPTPLTKWRDPDLHYVIDSINLIKPYLHKGQVIVLESTTYPGTTEEILKPAIEAANFIVGKDIFLAYSPEREDPGNKKFTTANIPRVCGGITASCLEVAIALYEQIVVQVIPVSSTRAAEMTKLLENIHRAVNIGLVNEIKIVADKMGIDVFEVINAAATKPFGFVPYYPGPGLGGHCIPVDPFYLTWKAKEFGIHTRFIELAGEVNSTMPSWVMDKIVNGLNFHHKPIRQSKILILGVSYKKNVDDLRESPALVIMEKLQEKGAIVGYCDPYVSFLPQLGQASSRLMSISLSPQELETYDCVVITTAHDFFDFEMIKKYSKLIVDTRGVYSHEISDHIIKA